MPSLPVQRLARLARLTRFSVLCALVCASFVLLSACDDDTTNDNTNTTGEDTRFRPTDTNSTSTTDTPTATNTDGTSGAVDTAGGLPGVTQGCAACEAPLICVDDWCVPGATRCQPGETDVCYNDAAIMTCDATGVAFVPVNCFPNHLCAEGACRPIVCDLGVTYCDGDNATHACNSDRTGFLPSVPCPDGLLCTEGVCASSECRPDPKLGSYVGCVYWSADLPVWPDPAIRPTNPQDLPHALVISNPNPLEATIAFAAPPGYVINNPNPIIPPMQSRVFEMPVISLDGTGIFAKGIGIGSNRPVLVHQFNPWEAVWSNDASLLLPETFLGREYVVHSWPTDPRGLLPTFPGVPAQTNVNSFFSVLAPSDDTQVTITVTAPVKAGPGGVLAMTAGSSQTVTLNRGEVLNIEAEPANLFDKADLTGSFVSASKPVAVFGGHESAAIGPENTQDTICCLDHLEEQMLPFAVLGTEYLAVKTKPRGSDSDVWRIIAAEDNVTITTTPQQGANGQTLAKRGDWIEVVTPDSFEITATGKVQVGQYLWSQQVTDDFTGDPSLILAVPAERFRTFYALTVPDGYATNWVTVIKPIGSTVEVDGVPSSQALFQTFASGRFEFGYIELSPGVHQIEGDLRFGLIAYGFNGAVSYGYTGGLSGSDEP